MKPILILFLIYCTFVIASELSFTKIADRSPWQNLINDPKFVVTNNFTWLIYDNNCLTPELCTDLWISTDYGLHWFNTSTNILGNKTFLYLYCNDELLAKIWNYDYTVTDNTDYSLWETLISKNWIPVSIIENKPRHPMQKNPPSKDLDYTKLVSCWSYKRNIYFNRTNKSTLQELVHPHAFRFNIRTSTHYNNLNLQGHNISYIFGGYNHYFGYLNILEDLWASSDSGQSWIPILRNLPWDSYANKAVSFAISPLGIMIASIRNITDKWTYKPVTNYIAKEGEYVTTYYKSDIFDSISNKTDFDPSYLSYITSYQTSDLWASLDGGYTWRVCIQMTPYGDRYNSILSFGQDGHLYMIGGIKERHLVSVKMSDVWRSDAKMADPKVIAELCGIKIPEKGIGITSWPQSWKIDMATKNMPVMGTMKTG